jgi:hypothetical protein
MAEGGGGKHCCQVGNCHGLAWLAWGLGFGSAMAMAALRLLHSACGRLWVVLGCVAAA